MNDNDIERGATVHDPITNMEGTVTAVAFHLTGCTRVSVRPRSHDMTEHTEEDWYYAEQLKWVQSAERTSGVPDDAVTECNSPFTPGQRVREELTDTEGIVGVVSYELFNCPRICIIPDTSDDDEDPVYSTNTEWFDAPRVEIIDEEYVGEFTTTDTADDDDDTSSATGPIGDDPGKPSPLR